MQKKDILVLLFLVGITAILSVFVVFTSSKAEKVIKAENVAHQELSVSVENHKSFFKNNLEEKFSVLESLSYYLGIKEKLDFPAEREYSDAVILANRFDCVYLSDLNGSISA